MKTTLTAMIFVSLIFTGVAAAHEGHEQGSASGTTASDDVKSKAAMGMPTKLVEVGNKICPVSGEKVGEMGDVVKIEHEGKVYNLCCAMCKKDFQKDPQKYIDKVNEEMKASDEAQETK